MATEKAPKSTMTVTMPKGLVAGAKSRQRPRDQSAAGTTLTQRLQYSLMNRDVGDYRAIANSSAQITALMRELCRIEGPISTAVHNLVQVANSPFKVWVADAATNRFSYEGWQLAKSILAAFDTGYDYSLGFVERDGMETTKESLLREVVITGGCAMELVLNKARLPDQISIVGIETLEWQSDGKGGKYPTQRIAGKSDPVNLDIATFYTSFSQPDPGMIMPRSMMESAMKLLIFFEELLQDIRRTIKRNGYTRTTVALDVEKIIATAPKDIQKDANKLKSYLESTRSDIERTLSQIEPDDALVMFDTAKAENLQSGLGSKVDYTTLLSTIAGLYSSSMKTPPSAIGLRLEGGSQALGNVESLIFLKSAKAVQTPVAEVLSRALTLACRLHGMNVYCKFMFDKIDLRPESELSAFRTMEQDRIFNLLSLGLISDEEAAWHLGLEALPEGYENLSGTRFHSAGGNKAETLEAPGDSGMGRTLKPGSDLPRKGGGKSQ